MQARRTIPLASLAVALLSTATPTAGAADLEVTTTDDGPPGSLRAAVVASNASAGSDAILLPPGTYTLSLAGTDEDAAATGDLDLTDVEGVLSIRGAGADLTVVDAAGLDTVFDVLPGVSVEIEDLTVRGGAGAGLRGGGLFVQGVATLRRCQVRENTASFGGGLRVTGFAAAVTVEDSTFTQNQGSGGAIESQQAPVTISGSTVSGNTGGGGAIRLSNANVVELRNSTVVGNDSPGLVVTGGTAVGRLVSSIVADNNGGGADLDGAVESLGHNLIGDPGVVAGFVEPGDRTGSTGAPLDPLLGVLTDNGGPTPTHAPLLGSPTLDAGANPDLLTEDQRGPGFPRELGTGTDTGSVEPAGVQNRLENPHFDEDVSGWDGFPTFSTDDSDGDPESGSLQGNFTCSGSVCGRLLGQCAAVAGGADYWTGADLRIPPGQELPGFVQWRAFWYSDSGCGDFIQSILVGLIDQEGDWTRVEDLVTSPAGARSVRVGGNVNATNGPGTFQARIDDAVLAPEPTAAAAAVAAGLALVATGGRRRS